MISDGCVDTNKRADETELEYIWRLGNYRANGILDLTWDELAEILNKNLREPDEYYGSSAYRKKYSIIRQAYEEIFSKEYENGTGAELCNEITALKRELEKERVKLRDEKNDYRRMLREQARKESLSDFLGEAVAKLNSELPMISFDYHQPDIRNDKEAIACFSDWHYGLITDNIWNKYNPEISVTRVNKCVYYMKKYLIEHNIYKLHLVILGDLAHGAIHNCRLYSREDVCDQLMQVSEILANAINELSHVVDEVTVYTCYGNHMRTVQKKEDAKSSDNMEKIVPWWLEQRLKNNDKVKISYSQYKEFTLLNVLGYNVVCVHGNGFNFKDIGVITNQLFTRLFGVSIDYTISGDKHHLEEIDKFGIESILIRSLCGTDDYANDNHLYGKAGQTLMIFNKEYGRECTYHIPL